MGKITERDAKIWGLEGNWSVLEFDLSNPTSSDVSINLFDPNTLENVANTPYGFSPIDPLTTNPIPITPTGTTPNLFHAITVAPFNTTPVIYDSNNSKVWGGQKAGANIYTYSDNPPQTNPATFSTIATVLLNLTGLSFSPTSNKIAAVCATNGFITILDATTEAVIVNIAPIVGGFVWIEYNSTKDSWYATATGADIVLEISAVTNTVVAIIPIPAGTLAQRMGFNPNNNTMYIAGAGNNTIVKLDCSTNTFITYASPVNVPYVVQINPVDNLGYVASKTNFGIWKFNPTTNAPIANILALGRASDMQYYPSTNKMYAIDFTTNLMYIFNADDSLYESISYVGIGEDNTITLNTSGNIIYFSSALAAPPRRLNSLTAQPLFFNIGGSTDYNQFIRDIVNSPAWTRRIVFYTNNSDNFNQVVNHTFKDANGMMINFPLIPSLSVGMMQFQSGIGMLDFPNNDLILGINEWFSNFLVKANSSINLVLVYKQIEKTSILSDKRSLINLCDFTKEAVQQVSEEALENQTFFEYVPIISEKAYLNKIENLIKPFDLSSFNKVLDQAVLKK